MFSGFTFTYIDMHSKSRMWSMLFDNDNYILRDYTNT